MRKDKQEKRKKSEEWNKINVTKMKLAAKLIHSIHLRFINEINSIQIKDI